MAMEKEKQLKDALKKSLKGLTAKGVKVESVESITEISVYRYMDDEQKDIEYLDESVYEKGIYGYYSSRIRGITNMDGATLISNYEITNCQFKINDYRNEEFSIELGPIYNITPIG